MIIRINSGMMEAHIDTFGAYVVSLTKGGEEVFFEKNTIVKDGATKLRGGSHVCLPHFGPSEKVGQTNHGFARECEWTLVDKTPDTVKLQLQENYLGYEKMVAFIEYSLLGDEFSTKLIVKNEGDSEFTISPAFHPYFSYTNEDDVKVDNTNIQFNKALDDSLFYGQVHELKTGRFTINFEVENLEKFVVWSDNLDKYICVEPSFNHKALDDGNPLVEVEPGKQEEFGFTIKVL